MNCECLQIDGAVFAKSDLSVRARVSREVGNNLAYIQQTDFSAISYRLFDSAGVSTPVQSLVIADVVFNVIQVGSVWTKDTIGFNFAFSIPNAQLPVGNREYTLEIKFTLTGGKVFRLVREFIVLNVQSD